MYTISIYFCRHSLVPVVPAALLDYVQLPSTYIMGVHSSLKTNIGELVSTVLKVCRLVLPHACMCVPFLQLCVRVSGVYVHVHFMYIQCSFGFVQTH